MELFEITFWFSSLYIGPMWFLMWFMPRHEITKKIVGDVRICIIPLIVSYGILLIPNAVDVLISLGELFSDDQMIILAWLHFLVLDTFAGRYVWMRMLAADKPIHVSMPVLLMCMMMGPIGLVVGILATLDVKDDISVPAGSIE